MNKKSLIVLFLVAILGLPVFSAFLSSGTSYFLGVNELNSGNGNSTTYPLSKTAEPPVENQLMEMFLGPSGRRTPTPEDKIAPALKEESQYKDLRFVTDMQGNKRIFILFRGGGEELDDLLNLKGLETKWIAPLAGGNILVSAILKDSNILYTLASFEGVRYIAPDFYIYDIEKNFDENEVGILRYGDISTLNLKMQVKQPIISPEEGKNPEIGINAYKAVEIQGATDAWQLGYTGENITIAIVDTGVDYGVANLNSSYVVSEDGVLAFVPDGDCVVITTYTFTPYLENGTYYIATSGKTFTIFDGFWGWQLLVTFLEDFNVTNVVDENQNNVFHFGVMLAWLPTPTGYIVGFVVPVLVTDHDNDGVYDRVYVDLTGVLYSYASYVGLPVDPTWFDYKFEGPYYLDPNDPSKALIAIDCYYYNYEYNATLGEWVLNFTFGQDGYPDFSLGVIGVPFLDTMNMVDQAVNPTGTSYKLFREGIDPNGNWVGFMYDFLGHGTSCASTAAGRRVPFLFTFANDTILTGEEVPRWLNISGIAPNATVMGVRALSWGYLIEGWLYSAGFDLADFDTINNVGIWNYTGNHKADVISNSWGCSLLWAEYGGYMFAFDVLSVVETSLSLEGKYWGYTYLEDPLTKQIYNITNIENYQPSVFVHAEGNGGPGYGTANTGPWSPLAIQVGASTSWHWRPVYSEEAAGTYDQVAFWSGRGSTVVGLGGPDVVAIGSYAFETVPLSLVGIGNLAWDLFGGTSQATPMTAGAAALVIQAAKDGIGTLTPSIVKSLLMGYSEDLGYDVMTQGAGRINVYKAVKAALNSTDMDLGFVSDTVFKLASKTIGYNGSYDIFDIGIQYLFGGFRYPGDTVIFALNASKAFGDNDTITSANAKTLQLVDVTTVSFTLDPSKANYTTSSGQYFWFNATSLGLNLKSHDFVRIVYNTSDWYDAYLTGSGVSYTAAWLINDTNADGNVTRDEVKLINRFTGVGPIFTVEIGYPWQFEEDIGIGVFGYFTSMTTIKFTILYYDYTDMPGVTVTPPPGDHGNMTVQLNVPKDALPGLYWGYINVTNDDNVSIRIPFVYHVVANVNVGETVTYMNDFTSDNSTCPQYHWIQGYDILWREEVGEWRTFYFVTNESAFVSVTVEWNDPLSDAYVHVLDAEKGYVIFEELPDYLYAGQFEDRDPYGNSTSVMFPVAANRLYAVVVRAPVLGGSIYPVNFKISFDVIKRTGPVIDTFYFVSVGSLTEEIEWSGYVLAPEGIKNVTFVFDNGITATPSGSNLTIFNDAYWEITVSFPVDVFTEGNHTLTVLAYDELGVSSNVNLEFYVDRASPMLLDLTVNNSDLTMLPLIYDHTVNLTVSICVADLTPTIGTIEFYDYDFNFYVSYMWEFDFTSGVFTYLDLGLSATAQYDSDKGYYILTFNFTVSGTSLGEGVYYVYVSVQDYPLDTLDLYDEIESVIIDLNPPALVYYELEAIEGGIYYPIDFINETITNASEYIVLYDPTLLSTEFKLNNNTVQAELYASYGGYYEFYVPINLTWLNEGLNVLTVDVEDLFGRTSSFEIWIWMDTQPPYGTLSVPPIVVGTVNITFTYGDDGLGVSFVELYLDDMLYADVTGLTKIELDSTLFSDGEHTLKLRVVDLANREFTVETDFIIDNSPPVLKTISPTSGQILGTSDVYVEWSATENATEIKYFEVRLDDGDWINVTLQTNYTFEDVDDGNHTVYVRAINTAGFESYDYVEFIVDTTPPILEVFAPENNSYVNVNSVTVNWGATDETTNVSSYKIRIDDGTWVELGLSISKYEFTGLTEGSHTVDIVAIDVAGNMAVKRIVFIVDLTAPSATLTLPEGVQNGTFNVSVTFSDTNFEEATLYVDGSEVFTAKLAGTYNVTLNASSFADGSHTVRLVVRDKAGNTTVRTGTLKTGYYASHEEETVGRERRVATRNMILTGIGGLIGGAILGVAINMLIRRRQ